MSVVDVLTVIVTAVMLTGTLIFGIAYHVTTDGKWRTQTPAGMWLFTTNLLLGSLALLILLSRAAPWWLAWAGREWVLLAIYALYAIKPYWGLRLLRQAQRRRGEDSSHVSQS
jgi:hypothetical protein